VLYICTRLLLGIGLRSLCPTVCSYFDILFEPRNLVKTVALQTHIKELLISDLWPKKRHLGFASLFVGKYLDTISSHTTAALIRIVFTALLMKFY
jgi:hypothetical protein